MPQSATQNGTSPAVLVEDVRKSFGSVQALDGVNLEIPKGSLLAILGPNGAGKTTLVRVLTTLLSPDEGRAEVAGHDVVRDRHRVRSAIGLSGQYAAVDERLTGRENLELGAHLHHLDRDETRRTVDRLLERFGLDAAADRPARTYSGGMRRKLDLASALVTDPEVLFLDEPSVGLDPTSRAQLWTIIEDLVDGGMSVLLTTQYLEEADQLSDSIAVIDSGRVIAKGTASELKSAAGLWFVELIAADRDRVEEAADVMVAVLEADSDARIHHHAGRVRVPVGERGVRLDDVTRGLDTAGIAIAELALRQPTLDDVFLALTGSAAEPAGHAAAPAGEELGPDEPR